MKSKGVRSASSLFVVALLLVISACSGPTTPGNGGGVDNPPPPGGGANPTPLPTSEVVPQTSSDGMFVFTLKQTQPARDSVAASDLFTGVWAHLKNLNSTKTSYCFVIQENGVTMTKKDNVTPVTLDDLRFCGNGSMLRPRSVPSSAQQGLTEAPNAMHANLMPNPRERIPWIWVIGWNDDTRRDQGFPPDWANIRFRLGWNMDLPVATEVLGLDGPG